MELLPLLLLLLKPRSWSNLSLATSGRLIDSTSWDAAAAVVVVCSSSCLFVCLFCLSFNALAVFVCNMGKFRSHFKWDSWKQLITFDLCER